MKLSKLKANKEIEFVRRPSATHWVGNGFPVESIFSYRDIAKSISPFLLMDYLKPYKFESSSDIRGVGQHPHRGFETVTIVYKGAVSHQDSTGAGGTIGEREVQWMTAGSGIIHEEYHSEEFSKKGGLMEMIQLWINLPANKKSTAPKYQAISYSQIPELALPDNQGKVRVIAGVLDNLKGAASTHTPMTVLDIDLNKDATISLETEEGETLVVFVLKGRIKCSDTHRAQSSELVVYSSLNTRISLTAEEASTILILNGTPLNEPIVGHGPFVMNSVEEIELAIEEFNNGTFIK